MKGPPLGGAVTVSSLSDDCVRHVLGKVIISLAERKVGVIKRKAKIRNNAYFKGLAKFILRSYY
ncbi:MAG: hypothetical protein QXP49_01830, partial [Nitrososphaerota archaeon]